MGNSKDMDQLLAGLSEQDRAALDQIGKDREAGKAADRQSIQQMDPNAKPVETPAVGEVKLTPEAIGQDWKQEQERAPTTPSAQMPESAQRELADAGQTLQDYKVTPEPEPEKKTPEKEDQEPER